MPSDDPDGGASRVLFDAILHPHRSLGRGGRRALMAVVIVANLVIGGVFWALGAWPVIPFCGVDVLALWLALRVNTRAANQYEQVRLTDTDLMVTRVDARARVRQTRFHPYWLRVRHSHPDEPGGEVMLSSHGRSVGVGSFLSPDERAAFATALDDALRAWRRPPCPPAPAG